ncbi:helix-turn-helix domain-containing protein [Nonlabens antarcticus]|uniref:helix-turn-helix domain-containing protein n=1 Tax=Nonlabens antarcticus TaxID=392714 RepID=UPI00189115D7|nr:AraC family transcriptional regulator [Nonlabens antarcticus]
MDLIYQNALEESNIHLTDFNCLQSYKLLKAGEFYKIIWAKDKISDIEIDGCSFDLEKNQVVFCTPLNHIYIPKKQDGIIAIIFNREFYCIRDNDEEVSCNGFLFYGSSHPVIVDLNEKEINDFEMLYGIFQEEFRVKDKSQGEMIRAMLKRLIIKGTRLAIIKDDNEDLSTEKFDLMRKMHLLVEKNFKQKHKVSEYADLLNKSPKTLANVFKKHGNQTPLQIINERLVLEARRLLLFSDMSSGEIAFEIGFTDPGHFTTFFKKNVNSTPMNFKKNARLEGDW